MVKKTLDPTLASGLDRSGCACGIRFIALAGSGCDSGMLFFVRVA